MDSSGHTKDRRLKRHVEDFTEHVSLHGVRHVVTSNRSKLRRITWLLALCACLGLLLYAFITQLTCFLKFPVKTVLVVEKVDFFTFPAVTICNYNQFRKSIALKNPELANKLKSLFPIPEIEIGNTTGLFSFPLYLETGSDVNVTETLVSLAHQKEDMFLACYWLGRKVTCADYIQMRMTEIGVCYTFNSARSQLKNGPLITRHSGMDHGLLLRIYIQNSEYYYGEGASAGIKVRVHKVDEVPMVRQFGFSVAPGTTTAAALTLVEETLLPKPYGDCITSDDVSQRQLRHGGTTYTSEACKMELRADFVYENCGCKMFYDYGFREICKSEKQMTCAINAKENYTFHESGSAHELCPPRCNSQKYTVKLSTAAFPGQHILEDLQEKYGMNENTVRKNFLQLLIYFEETTVEKLTQVPEYTFASLLSDVGGQMGLCMGASLLTLVELLEFCLLAARGQAKR